MGRQTRSRFWFSLIGGAMPYASLIGWRGKYAGRIPTQGKITILIRGTVYSTSPPSSPPRSTSSYWTQSRINIQLVSNQPSNTETHLLLTPYQYGLIQFVLVLTAWRWTTLIRQFKGTRTNFGTFSNQTIQQSKFGSYLFNEIKPLNQELVVHDTQLHVSRTLKLLRTHFNLFLVRQNRKKLEFIKHGV